MAEESLRVFHVQRLISLISLAFSQISSRVQNSGRIFWSTLHSPTGFIGLHKDSMWSPYEVHEESMDFRGTLFQHFLLLPKSLHGLSVESMRSLWRLHIESKGT